MRMDGHLGELKPSNKLAVVITNLQSELQAAESSTINAVASRNLEIAEKYLVVFDLYCTVLNSISKVQKTPYSTLSGLILSKRYILFDGVKINFFAQVEFGNYSG
jgi:hypothetical protein